MNRGTGHGGLEPQPVARVGMAAAIAVFALACENPEPPKDCGPLPQLSVHVGETASVSACFNDPNGDALTYSAMSSDPGAVAVSTSGNIVTVTGVAPGNATVTITASDPEGLQDQQVFQVTVPNRPPRAVGTIADQVTGVGVSAAVSVASYFSDPDGEALVYAAESSNPAVASVGVSGSEATVTGVAQGSASVTVTAADPGGLAASLSFRVTVTANRPPEPVGAIADLEVAGAASMTINVAPYFRDPDGDALAYAAESSNPAVASVSVVGSVASVMGVAQGSALVTVTATDPDGLTASQSFLVAVQHRDRAALVALYNATGGPNWANNDNWLTDAPLGDWHGVFTDTAGWAWSLDLSWNDLTGWIPPELGRLADLVRLDLSENNLAGRIPPELGDLANLTDLSLSGNYLTGSIPPELGDLANLTYLRLSAHSQRGTSGPGLTGSIPPELGNLANLRTLDLSGNDLTGWIPPELGNLTDLTGLILSGNNLTGSIPPELGSLTDLTSLGLRGNNLTGSIPPELGNLVNLTGLDLYSNDLTGAIPPELANLLNLTWLDLAWNNLTGSIPPELGNLASVEYLILNENNLTGSIPPELGNLASLIILRLGENNLTGSIPPEVGNLPALVNLYLNDNNLTGSIPPEIGSLPSLRGLALHRNVGLSGSIPPEYAELSLDYFTWFDTDLCSPADESFQAWLQSISNHQGGPACDP